METIVRLVEARAALQAAGAVLTAHPSPATNRRGKRAPGPAKGLPVASASRTALAAGCGSGRRLGAARAGSQAARAAGGQAAQAVLLTRPACSQVGADAGQAERRGSAAGQAGGRPLVPIAKSSAVFRRKSHRACLAKTAMDQQLRRGFCRDGGRLGAARLAGLCYMFSGGLEGGLQAAFGGAQ